MKNIPLHSSQAFFNSVIGRPHSELNCWDLVKLFYREVLGVELPQYYIVRPWDMSENNKQILKGLPDFAKVDKPEFGDIILFRVVDLPCHVGVYLSEEKFVHSMESTGVVLERFAKWKKRITGYYTVI